MHDMERGQGRGAVIMKVMESRKVSPPSGYEEEGDDGEDFAGMARGHCQEGLKMAQKYLESEKGQSSPLRPKVEALASAYEDLLSMMNEGGSDEEGY